MSGLNIGLGSWDLTPELRQSIIATLWPDPRARPEVKHCQNAALNPYFRYYFDQCDLIALHSNGQYSSLKTHDNITRLAELLMLSISREEIRQRVASFLVGTAEQHENSMDLVSRLLLMIKIGDIPHEYHGGRPLEWKDGTLRDFVHRQFSATPILSHERIKLEKSFNGLNLGRIAGLEIHWTDNLADHLRLMHDDSVLCVFHHVTFLQRQFHSPMFPHDFVSETLRSIALLFPRYDNDIRKWFRGISVGNDQVDHALIEVEHLNAEDRQIEGFRYWRDRLVVVKQVYDESKPKSMGQWWHDRRNTVQWYTFWVAIVVLLLTVFFGVIQSIEGALQVYKAWNP